MYFDFDIQKEREQSGHTVTPEAESCAHECHVSCADMCFNAFWCLHILAYDQCMLSISKWASVL